MFTTCFRLLLQCEITPCDFLSEKGTEALEYVAEMRIWVVLHSGRHFTCQQFAVRSRSGTSVDYSNSRSKPSRAVSDQAGVSELLLEFMAVLLRKLWSSMRLDSSSSAAPTESFSDSEHLSKDLLCAIFLHLGSKDLAAASAVCRFWHSVAVDDILWESLLMAESGETWPYVLFMETYLRPELSERFIKRQVPLPFRIIYGQRCSLPRCLIVDGGSGYCKYGLGNQSAPEGKLATFLEFGSIESPLYPRIRNLYLTIFNRMQVKPSAQPMVISAPICQNDDTDTALAARRQFREITFSVLFDLGVPAVCAVNQAVLALYAATKISGVVVNIGFHVTSVVPILNGKVMRNVGVEVIGQGALRLTGFLSDLMHQNGTHFTSMYAVRTLKEKLCYVAEDYEAELLKETTASCYVGEEGTFTLKQERFQTGEILFQPRLSGMRAMSLHHAVALCMEHCSRLELSDPAQQGWFKSIVLAGGSACLPGLARRLDKELRNILPIEFTDGMTVIPPAGPNAVWTAARLLSNMSTFPQAWCVTKKKFRRQGVSILHAMAFDDD